MRALMTVAVIALLGGCAGLAERGRLEIGDRTLSWSRLCAAETVPAECKAESADDER